ncbi:hypothetical protein DSM106972_037980 [Dulcicalothrix desertica PCC 7102]|uniref:Uncharacterized protein n=1 Tax=Dulcicalothrix desertica PCC 7102 TaxID=232991 RepID=A0A3S1CMZ6_9CYAN|nr:hypothetical protein DSM106972_037980 [Dulcicalothrix desertica PCC 7102]TWH43456.1 hypothetical protein CAL7102_07179 [Dulcicalothrix desertica PCC 7102]
MRMLTDSTDDDTPSKLQGHYTNWTARNYLFVLLLYSDEYQASNIMYLLSSSYVPL